MQRVLEEYPVRKEKVKIIEHKQNKGIAATRNTGLKYVSGQYIIYCDSDDWIEETCMKVIEKSSCNMCRYCSLWLLRWLYQLFYNTKTAILTKTSRMCIRMMRGNLHCSTWNKLIVRTLYERTKIIFPEGVNMWEDVCTIIPLCFHANKIAYVSEPLLSLYSIIIQGFFI